MTRPDLAQRHALHGLAAFMNIARHFILQQHALAVTMRGIGNRDRRDKLAGIRVLRVFKHRPSRPNLHDLPHNITATRWLMRSTTAISCEINRKAMPISRYTLPLPAGKLVRITPGVLRLQADALQQPGHATLGRFAVEQIMHPQRLHNRIPHRMARIEGGIRILENKLNISPHRLQPAVRKGINALAVKGDAAFLRFHQTEQRAPGGGFTAAGLPHQRQRFARPEIETDVFPPRALRA
ncbi:hypothetical protein L1887_52446 [Cichorium endivia]|nr:hypothetical protein L1887_52446 [Cichorium endivia]